MSKDKTLLIVDDSKVSRMMITAIIKEKHPDINILEAADGDEAISVSSTHNINFFSIDYNMPGINGIDLIIKLKDTFKESKFALLTANIQDATHNKAESAGAVCINKPISESSINKMIEHFYSE